MFSVFAKKQSFQTGSPLRYVLALVRWVFFCQIKVFLTFRTLGFTHCYRAEWHVHIMTLLCRCWQQLLCYGWERPSGWSPSQNLMVAYLERWGSWLFKLLRVVTCSFPKEHMCKSSLFTWEKIPTWGCKTMPLCKCCSQLSCCYAFSISTFL